MGWRESKSLYEALSPGQILGSVCSSLALEHIVIPLHLVHLPWREWEIKLQRWGRKVRQLASQRNNFVFCNYWQRVHGMSTRRTGWSYLLFPTPDCKREAELLWSCNYNFPSGKKPQPTLWWEWEEFPLLWTELEDWMTAGVATCCAGEFANTCITSCLISTQISLYAVWRRHPQIWSKPSSCSGWLPELWSSGLQLSVDDCCQTAVTCKGISHSRKRFLCFFSCQKSWMWQRAEMGMLPVAPSSCPLPSPTCILQKRCPFFPKSIHRHWDRQSLRNRTAGWCCQAMHGQGTSPSSPFTCSQGQEFALSSRRSWAGGGNC